MSTMLCRLGGVGFACVLVSSANAQLLTSKDLRQRLAMTIAQTAMEACKAHGYQVSVTVVGRLAK